MDLNSFPNSSPDDSDDSAVLRPQGIEAWGLDDLITLEEAAKALPGRRHLSTVYRWADQGLRGVCLTCVSVGHQRYTTLDWLRNFLIANETARTTRTSEDAELRFLSRLRNQQRSQPRAQADNSDEQTRDTLRRHGLDSDYEPEDLS